MVKFKNDTDPEGFLKSISTPTTTIAQASSLFYRLFTENLIGTVAFELIKLFHNMAIFAVMSRTDYGTMGLLYSIIFLTVSLTDAGWSSALPIFIRRMTDSQTSIRNRLAPYLFLQLPLIILGITTATFFLAKSYAPLATLGAFLIATESIRSFLRTFLHTLTINIPTMTTELIATSILVITIWTPYLLYGTIPTITAVFTAFMGTSLMAVAGLITIAYNNLKQLPLTAIDPTPWNWRDVFTSRLTTATSTTLRQVTTGNFIVTALSYHMNVEALAPIKHASYIADAVRSSLKSTIGFSGGALLATLRTAPRHIKQALFTTMSKSYVDIIPPLLIFIFSQHAATITTQTYLILPGTLVAISILEHLFFVYEQFYIVEKQALIVAIIRSAELIACYLIFTNHLVNTASPTITIITLLSIRIASTMLLAYDGYTRHNLRPSFPRWFLILITLAITTTPFIFK